ncbi:hypothetical protein ECANGB1_796 [Enterospora canceri]|uniref:RRM domain-containing protein n=1 Tax=Enterospora canceri TaxID=1081671 RepID=A0A1Y1S883_9MICR|nr:hypothetical protein ECANGB1_796 [Enterospora canceri]
MATSDLAKKERKTCILGINKAPLTVTIADVVANYRMDDLILVKRFTSKHYGTANFLLEFLHPEACERARALHSAIKLDGTELYPFYAPSNALQQHTTVVSENKLYVKYPSTVSFDSLKEKLSGLKITEPGKEGHFCFITCADQDEQAQIKQKYNGALVDGRPISVTYAINKVKKTSNKRRPSLTQVAEE